MTEEVVDIDELQMKDECNKRWVKAWHKAMLAPEFLRLPQCWVKRNRQRAVASARPASKGVGRVKRLDGTKMKKQK